MMNVFIINGHQKHEFSSGKLNQSLVDRYIDFFKSEGCTVKSISVDDDYHIEEEVEKHAWADIIILQSPVYWMGVPWKCKKYMDEVYMAGAQGILCSDDGRTRSSGNPKKGYGTGGKLGETQYMISLTLNAPKEAFNDPQEYLFQGKDIDDLFLSTHMNMRFLGAKQLPTFVCYDVIKNPEIENDFERLDQHLRSLSFSKS